MLLVSIQTKRNVAGRRSYACLLLFLLFLVAACATPVGVKRADPRDVHQNLTSNVLSAGKLSGPTTIVLNRHDLYQRFDKEPEAALVDLHKIFVSGRGGEDELSALAELSFLHAEETGKRSYYLAAAIYAYAFLFPSEGAESPSPFDPRFRLACDLYNRGLTSGFLSEDKSTVELRSGMFELSFGSLEVDFDRASLKWDGRELVNFEPVADLEVRGLRNRYRQSGIGAPLAAGTVPSDSTNGSKGIVGPKAKVPVTLVLRLEEVRQQLRGDLIRGAMRLYATNDVSALHIGSQNVPLEAEPSASLASGLSDSSIWEMETKAFLGGDHIRRMLGQTNRDSQLVSQQPYQPGLIPVVFVHGTASSPGRWADITNELRNDPLIRKRFQLWYFFYDTGNPIAYSAMLLRETLTKTVESLDPEGKDPALKEMVLIGHSQGGLLAKMTAIDSGNRFWENASKKPFDEVKMSDKTRDLLRRALFIEPLPFVKRLIFVATPQRGSFIAAWKIAKWMTGLLVKPATTVLGAATDVLKGDRDALALQSLKDFPTSVTNMTPGNRFIATLASIPVAPGVAYHSIIAVKQEGAPVTGDDGVVKYQSAHLEGAQSELVVHSNHSCQANPYTIEEVRRILLLHAAGGQ